MRPNDNHLRCRRPAPTTTPPTRAGDFSFFLPLIQLSNSRSPKKNLLPFLRFSFFSRFSSYVDNKGSLHGSGSGSDRILMEMDSDSKPLQQKHEPNFPSSDNSSFKILTLPIVLTLGRVAAVPRGGRW
ncbi:hypothetical protein HRI_004621900 [Hibiscus trionum]|uniref:Uncharacterized protein n=1 Tax=Hibiscus trionum TaxID=183268 RepID=A0A9W7JAB3_HIBTR|nr:hypothetical protein HRI_004621900 [Hibiscus trionum]